MDRDDPQFAFPTWGLYLYADIILLTLCCVWVSYIGLVARMAHNTQHAARWGSDTPTANRWGSETPTANRWGSDTPTPNIVTCAESGTVAVRICLPTQHTALSDQAQPSSCILHGAYYLKDRGTRTKAWQRVCPSRAADIFDISTPTLSVHSA